MSEGSKLERYQFEHSKRYFISTGRHVLSSMYVYQSCNMCKAVILFRDFLGVDQVTANILLVKKNHSKILLTKNTELSSQTVFILRYWFLTCRSISRRASPSDKQSSMTIVFTSHGDLELVHFDWLKDEKRSCKKHLLFHEGKMAHQRKKMNDFYILKGK